MPKPDRGLLLPAEVIEYRTGILRAHGAILWALGCPALGVIAKSLGRLVSASNPEADGVTSYTYFPNGALHTKTDPRNVTTTYAVDGLDRVLTKGYNDGSTPGVRYCYDGNHLQYSGSSWNCVPTTGRSDYAQGALTHSAAVSAGAIVSQTEYTNIDPLGRVTASRQTTSGLDSPKQFAYTYAPGGALSGVQYPSGRWVTYDINGANRVNKEIGRA